MAILTMPWCSKGGLQIHEVFKVNKAVEEKEELLALHEGRNGRPA